MTKRLLSLLGILIGATSVARSLPDLTAIDATVVMFALIIVLEFIRSRKGLDSFQPIVIACALLGIGLQWYSLPRTQTASQPRQPQPVLTETTEDDSGLQVNVNRRTGNVTATFDIERLRQKRLERMKLRQEDPEQWRKEIRSRTKATDDDFIDGN